MYVQPSLYILLLKHSSHFSHVVTFISRDISDNEIATIESNTFHGLPKLRTL